MGGVGKVIDKVTGGAAGKAGEAASAGAKKTAQWQEKGLDYLKQQEKLPTELRDLGLKGLAGLYGLPGYEDTLDLVGKAQGSPLYQAMVQQIDQSLMEGQDATGRQASMGGFLRSGVLAKALAEQQQQAGVAKAGALSDVYQQYLGGISGLANQPLNTNAIANMYSNIGQTRGQGIIGAEQTRQAGYQQNINNAMEVANMAGGLLMMSDLRLKDNIRYVGDVNGHRWYEWEWNDKAKELGLDGTGGGVMAHEVEQYMPEAIGEHNGYMTVNYDLLRVH